MFIGNGRSRRTCKDIRQRILQREAKSWGARNEVFQLQKENLVGMISVCRVNSVGKLRQESDSCLSFPTELTLHTLIIRLSSQLSSLLGLVLPSLSTTRAANPISPSTHKAVQ